MSDKEINISDISQSEGLRRKIDAARATLREKYSVCKAAARRLSGAYARLVDAESRLDLKQSARLVAKHAIQETQYNVALKEYFSCAELYSELVSDIISLYNELYLSEDGRAARKIKAEAIKFESQQYRLMQKIQEGARDVAEAIGAFDKQPQPKLNDTSKAEVAKKAEPQPTAQEKVQEHIGHTYAQPQYPQHSPADPYRQYPPYGVSIAPMSIDISAIVEDAVAAAMEKFKAAFNKEANAFIADMPKAPAPAESGAVEDAGASPALAAVAEEEQVISEKLSSLMENLRKLSDEMTNLGAAYMQLANTQRDAADLQRRINDMQRSVSREIQGVQANQKVINRDQAAVTAEQTVVMEQQRANLEGQKLLIEASDGISDMQKTVIETQGAIEASMREMLGSQKEIISSQQSVMNAGAKNAELQRELSERQSELLEMQKSVMSSHKQLLRAQRNFNIKNSIPEKKEKQVEEKGEASEALSQDEN